MSIDIAAYGKQFLKDYEENDFEVILTKYRKRKVIDILKNYNTDIMLEIGCGIEPFFLSYNNFNKMIIVEPADIMYRSACEYSRNNNKIICINDFIENQVCNLSKQSFDFILLVGLIHEVEDPIRLIKAVYNLCDEKTKVLVVTNNPNSFHLTLAYESGIINELGILTEKAKVFQRHNTFNMKQMKLLLEENGFEILEEGSYFVKPFAHSQMKSLLDQEIITMDVIDGLDKMIKYMPELGAEIYCVVQKTGV